MDDDFYVQLGKRIRIARKDQGRTQEDIAARLDINRTTFVNIEKGRQRLAVHQLVELADALGCKPEDLLPSNGEVYGVDEEREQFVALVRSEKTAERS
jgi:transcriptional regulator with XRE-family HTH domain